MGKRWLRSWEQLWLSREGFGALTMKRGRVCQVWRSGQVVETGVRAMTLHCRPCTDTRAGGEAPGWFCLQLRDMGMKSVVENQTLCMHIFACGTEKLWANSFLQQNNLSANKFPPSSSPSRFADRQQEHKDGQEETSVEGRVIRREGKPKLTM